MHKALGCVLFAAFAVPGIATAQNTIRGRALDENGQPVANIEVLLHRVTTGGGSTVDRDTSDATGAFTLVAPAERDSSALFFVAIREGGELFMGEMQRLPFPDSLEYFVEVGDNPVNLGEPAPPVAEEDKRAGLFVIIGGALLVAAVLLFALRRRAPEHRRLLVELANLDDNDASEATRRRRQRLYARLRRDA